MLVIWSLVAVFFIGILGYGISTGKSGGDFFRTFKAKRGEMQVRKEQEMELGDTERIRIDLSSEDIYISLTNDDKVKVIESADIDTKKDEQFTMEKNGKDIEIVQGGQHKFYFFSVGFNKKIEVMIPEKYRNSLDIKSSSGDVDINGNLNLASMVCSQSSGNLESRSSITANEFRAKVSSGNIELKEILTKNYTVNSSSGNIEIESISGSGNMEAKSGNIEVGYKDIEEATTLRASSGNININVPKDLSFEFYGECSSGDVKADFEINYKDKNGHKAAATVGKGPYKKISTKTSSGNIYVNQR